jgi:hypothetical protein
MPQPPRRPQQNVHPHAKLDQYEQHLKGEMQKIKAVRTLYPPPQLPGAPKKTR